MSKNSAKEVNEKAAAAKESSLDDDDSNSESESESEPEISQPVFSQKGRKIIRNWNPKHGTPPSDFASGKSQKQKKKDNASPTKSKPRKKVPVKSGSQKRKEKDDISPSKKKQRSKSPVKKCSNKKK